MRLREDQPLCFVRRVLPFPASLGGSDDHSGSPLCLSYPYSERLPGNISKFPKPGLSLASCEDANDIPLDEGSLPVTPEGLRAAMEALLSPCPTDQGAG